MPSPPRTSGRRPRHRGWGRTRSRRRRRARVPHRDPGRRLRSRARRDGPAHRRAHASALDRRPAVGDPACGVVRDHVAGGPDIDEHRAGGGETADGLVRMQLCVHAGNPTRRPGLAGVARCPSARRVHFDEWPTARAFLGPSGESGCSGSGVGLRRRQPSSTALYTALRSLLSTRQDPWLHHRHRHHRRPALPLHVRSGDHRAGDHRHAARLLEPGGFGETLATTSRCSPRRSRSSRRARRRSGARHDGDPHPRGAPSGSHGSPRPRRRPAATPRWPSATRGPRGRILVRGEEGHDIIDDLAPIPARRCSTSPQGRVLRHRPRRDPAQCPGSRACSCAASRRGVRAHHRREANDRGFECLVIEDGCGSYFPEFHAMALRMISAQGGIFGWTATSAELLPGLSTPGSAGAEPAPSTTLA